VAVVAIDEHLRRRREAALQAHLDAEATGDTSRILATFAHPRYELIGGTGRAFEGVEQVRGYLTRRHQAFPDLHTEVIALHHAIDSIAAELWLIGTYTGTVDEVPDGAKPFRCRVASFFEFREADLVGIRTYFDMATIARQLA
jgi:predicted ester cyclase